MNHSILVVVTLAVALPSTLPTAQVEDAAVRLREALRVGDRVAARAMLVAPTTMDESLGDDYLTLLLSAERLRQAIEKAFPHDRGPTTNTTTAPIRPTVRVIRQDARSADVELAPDAPPVRFILTDAGWRLDLSVIFPDDQDAERQRAVVAGLTAIIDELCGEILAERYVSLVDVRTVMAMRTSDLLANLPQRRTTTQPAR